MKKILGFILMPALLIAITDKLEASNGKTITVTDMGKRTVTVPFDPKRIICLSQGTLRLICYLQATDRVVGIEDFEKTRPYARPYIIANSEITKLPRIGPGGPASINKEPDLEAVLQVKPDIIFTSYMEPRNADELQKKLGIPVVLITPGRFGSFDEAVYRSLRVSGQILNKEKRADEVIAFIENSRKDLVTRTSGIDDSKKPKVYVGAIGFKGVQGIESTDAGYTPLEWIGANNIAKKVAKGEHLFIDKEQLLSLNPSIIFVDGGGLNLVKQDIQKRPEYYKGLKAFDDKKVYVLYPFNYYVTNVDTAIADAYAVGKILYPDKFSDVSLPVKADEIYNFLVGKPVYKEMEKDFGPLGRVVDLQIR